MSFALISIAEREEAILAPYAFRSAATRGRKHAEKPSAYRGPFQRDRDRIVHSGSYRRLAGKMQVFTGDRGDYHRTRLTHTFEVASIARSLGRALRLNEDLVEALALLHDVGHPPFGHAGEDALAECLAKEGGFSHNRFALTLVEEIEQPYPTFPGLNLSHEVLDGQLTRIDKKRRATEHPLLEVQVVEAADSIAYNAHDTDDAIKLGLVSLREFEPIALTGELLQSLRENYRDVEGEVLRKLLVKELIDRQVCDLLGAAGEMLQKHQPANAEAARHLPAMLGPSAAVASSKRELEAFLYRRVYRHEQLIQVRQDAQTRLRKLFDFFVAQPESLPDRYQARMKSVGLRQSTAEYLAGMTDRFCNEQFARYCGE